MWYWRIQSWQNDDPQKAQIDMLGWCSWMHWSWWQDRKSGKWTRWWGSRYCVHKEMSMWFPKKETTPVNDLPNTRIDKLHKSKSSSLRCHIKDLVFSRRTRCTGPIEILLIQWSKILTVLDSVCNGTNGFHCGADTRNVGNSAAQLRD